MAGVASDIEMADACAPSSTSSSDLTPPPTYSSDYEELPKRAKKTSPKKTVDLLNARDDPESEAIGTELTGTHLPSMTRRSARNSTKPKPVTASPPRVTKKKQPTRVVPKKVPKWTTQKLLTDPNSPLASANLRAMLCQPAAWDILTKEERAEIVNLFPAGTRILDAGTDDARPDFDALRNDNNFRHDCATYADNISLGKHDPEWLEQAWGARERRRAGDFDDHVTQKFEDEWSCNVPEGFKPDRSSIAPGPAASAEVEKTRVEQKEEITNQAEEQIIDNVQVEGDVVNQAEEVKATVKNVPATTDTTNDVNMAEENEAREAPGVTLGSPLPDDISSAKNGAPTSEISELASAMPESSGVPLASVALEDSSPKTNLRDPGEETEKQKEKE
ncbi:hypothetical protein CSAL01_02382 [Colletotrichum salicis]|uniref:DEUBAD domain-containing protein n=1 Tax=Colletotrichum salicis TaxID=1209931 RepID=A0A135ULI2_9PEZI|nr:hypothetical protein CSAL01_02382 [Colletotrichum salicis]